MKKRYTDEQIIGFLKQAEAGAPIKELCRKHGFSDASFYLWRRRFGGMNVPDAKRLRELESEKHQTANRRHRASVGCPMRETSVRVLLQPSIAHLAEFPQSLHHCKNQRGHKNQRGQSH